MLVKIGYWSYDWQSSEGNQKADDLGNLVYGKSITDACINWQDIFDYLHRLAEAVDKRKTNWLYHLG